MSRQLTKFAFPLSRQKRRSRSRGRVRQLLHEWLESRNLLATNLFEVTNTSDSGPGSLRQAILDANASTDSAEIQFNIPTSDPGFVDVDSGIAGGDSFRDVFRIQPTSRLPILNNAGGFSIEINGASQTSNLGNTNPFGPEIEIDGSLAGENVSGLQANSHGVLIHSIVIGGFSQHGIQLLGNNATVRNSYLGTTATGLAANENASSGIASSNNTNITIGPGNVLSGNWQGISLGMTTNVSIFGNTIGLGADGETVIGNETSGINTIGSTNVMIGGSESSDRNVISGNSGADVFLQLATNTNVTIEGNYLGLTADGATGVGTSGIGVRFENAESLTVRNNVIASQTFAGMTGFGNDTVIEGNHVGTNASGDAAIGIGVHGIEIGRGSYVIGGEDAAQGNVVVGAGQLGIRSLGFHDSIRVLNNKVGTSAAGSAALPNGSGISVDLTESDVAEVVGNLVSGNQQYGIGVFGQAAQQTVVRNNRVGVTADGRTALPNGSHGMVLHNTADVLVDGNLVSGNGAHGLDIVSARELVVRDNRLGTNVVGDSAIPNSGNGVSSSNSYDISIEDNLVSGNDSSGISILDNTWEPIVIHRPAGNGLSASWYWVTPDRRTWTSANSLAKSLGGDLATINNAFENEFITEFNNNRLNQNLWIGLSDASDEGNFSWSSGATVTYTNWDSGEPNGGTFENYVAAYPTGFWNDFNNGTIQALVEFSSAPDLATLKAAYGAIEVTVNVVGASANGLSALGNGNRGIEIRSSESVIIGGSTPNASNRIVDSANDGIQVRGFSRDIQIQGNIVGLSADGMTLLGNETGIRIESGSNILVGGPNDADGNVIVGSQRSGITMLQTGSVSIENNSIGVLDALDLGNEDHGILINGSHGTTITGNHIAANSDIGIAIASENEFGVLREWAVADGGNGNWYYKTPRRLNWHEAAALAESLGGQLATINDALENEFLTTNIMPTASNGWAWMGYNDFDAEGTWRWLSGELSSYENFRDGQPNGGQAGDFGHMYTDGTWGDGRDYDLMQSIIEFTSEPDAEVLRNIFGSTNVSENLIGLSADESTAIGNGGDGIQIASSRNVIVESSTIADSGRFGIASFHSQELQIRANFIGTNSEGTATFGNKATGVEVINSTQVLVGGPNPSDRNVISGNLGAGVYAGGGTEYLTIANNRVGTNAAGTTAFSDQTIGLRLEGSEHITLKDNLLAGHNDGIIGFDLDTVTVQGNKLGTNAAGTSGLPVGGVGISFDYVSKVLIGGDDPSDANLIGNHTQFGIFAAPAGRSTTTSGADYLHIRGNRVGTNVSGTAAIPNANGILTRVGNATGVVIEANLVSGNHGNGLWLQGDPAEPVLVLNNIFGLNAAGDAALPNGSNGINLDRANSVIVDSNVLSGNAGFGIRAEGFSNDVIISNNLVGLDATSSFAVPNGLDGIQILNSLSASVTSNTVAGNNRHGISNYGGRISADWRQWKSEDGGNDHWYWLTPFQFTWLNADAFSNSIGGHLATSTSQEENEFLTSLLAGRTDTAHIGLTDQVSEGNFQWVTGESIDYTNWGNNQPDNFRGIEDFVELRSDGTWNDFLPSRTQRLLIEFPSEPDLNQIRSMLGDSVFEDNQVGFVGEDGTPIGNQGRGIDVWDSANVVIANSTIVRNGQHGVNIDDSQSILVEQSTIAHNANDGFSILGDATTATIRTNSIFSNGEEGIDLQGDGFTQNDADDTDEGPNGLQNFPVLGVVDIDNVRMIRGTLHSMAESEYSIDIFGSNALSRDEAEGDVFLQNVTVTTNAIGLATFSIEAPSGFRFVTSTATNANGATSEISQAVDLEPVEYNGDLAENNAELWGTFAIDTDEHSITNSTQNVTRGSHSLLFSTASAFDTGVIFPAAGDAIWDLEAWDLFIFDTFSDNPNIGFQDAQPIVVFNASGGQIIYTPDASLTPRQGPMSYAIPLSGDEVWTRSVIGTPDASQVYQFEIHQDTWDDSFDLWYDNVRFVTSDMTRPESSIADLPPVAESTSFEVSVVGNDPESSPTEFVSGVKEYDLFVSTNGSRFRKWATVPVATPSATFDARSNQTYFFRSLARDHAGNEELVAGSDAVIFVPDLTPPASRVLSVDTQTPTFDLQVRAVDRGGSGLRLIRVLASIDGEPFGEIRSFTPSHEERFRTAFNFSYDALQDGIEHEYRFVSEAYDWAGNVESIAANGDVSVRAQFGGGSQLAARALDVANGLDQRSYIRNIEIAFNTANGLDDLLATIDDGDATNDRLVLERFELDGSGLGERIALAGLVNQSTSRAKIDFGVGGIGGVPNSNAGDGYYRISIDNDGDGILEQQLHFYRLLGDTNSDRIVSSQDLAVITNSLRSMGYDPNADVNGDGVVNVLDRSLALSSLSNELDAGLPLDD